MKLDHNQAVKALREGRTIRAFSEHDIFIGLYTWNPCRGVVFKIFEGVEWRDAYAGGLMKASYFTLEEEEKIEDIRNIPDRLIAWTGLMDLDNPPWPRNQRNHMVELLKILFYELDKRYERKK